jgi:phi13 family phage major tail protein
MAGKSIHFGVSNARYALETEDGFGPWKRLPGAVNINLEPQESQNDFYADNELYFTANGAASDQVTIELADLPDEAKVDLIGYEEINGDLALPVNYEAKPFVLGFQYEGNESAIRVNVFGGKLKRSTESHGTKTETTEPQTVSYEGKFSGKTFVVNGEEKAYLYYSTKTGKDNYAGWWDEVKTPGDVAEAAADTTLSAITIGSLTLTPTFSAGVTTYTATTENASDAITATATDENATVAISVGGVSVDSGDTVTWSEGTNVVSVIVTNDGDTGAYTVVVTKE